MANDKYWYGLVINASSYYGNSDKIVTEITNILQTTVQEILVVNDKKIMETGEYFIFINGKNTIKKKENLLKLSGLLRIISVGDQPYVFSEREIASFTNSIEKKNTAVCFKKGDVVLIKDGCYKNLFGLVIGNQKEKVKVLLRFHVRDFTFLFESKQLKKEKNIFDVKPSNIDKKEWFNKFMEK